MTDRLFVCSKCGASLRNIEGIQSHITKYHIRNIRILNPNKNNELWRFFPRKIDVQVDHQGIRYKISKL